MFCKMMTGDTASLRAITDKDLKFMSKLIQSVMDEAASTGYPYIDRLFDHHVSNVHEVTFNLSHHGYHYYKVPKSGNEYFGFKKWRPLWFGDIDDDQTLDICFFLKLFRNLKSFVIGRWDVRYRKSMKMSEQFVETLLNALALVNEDHCLSQSFTRLFVVNPDLMDTPFDNLEDVVKEYNAKFAAFGWELKRDTFYYLDDPNDKCDHSLLITKA